MNWNALPEGIVEEIQDWIENIFEKEIFVVLCKKNRGGKLIGLLQQRAGRNIAPEQSWILKILWNVMMLIPPAYFTDIGNISNNQFGIAEADAWST